MSQAGSLTKNPTLLTAVLSLAAIAGYVTFRLTVGANDPAAEAAVATAVMSQPAAGADHDHEHVPLPDALPEFVLDDLNGTPTALASFAGQPLVINFWATWCGPCLREIPLLKRFHEEDPSIRVLGIAADRLDDVLEYAETMEFNYPGLVGQTASYDAMAAFGNEANVLPFSVFTSAEGAVLGNFAGELHPEHLAELSATIAELTAGVIDRETARERLARLRDVPIASETTP